MRRITAAVLLAMALGGCTGTRLVQRDGCWIKQTTKIFRHTEEDLGPCARTSSPWAEDRLTRLMQECVAREDYRWQMRAIAAWNRGEPWPQPNEQNVLATCMTESTRMVMNENDALKKKLDGMGERVAEVSKDRDALRARSDEERKRMLERVDDERKRMLDSQDKLAAYLGEAAKKSSQPATATATATSDGRLRSESTEGKAAPVAVVAPPATVVTPPTTFISAPACVAPAAETKSVARPPAARKAPAPRPAPECPPALTAAAPQATEDEEAKALAAELMKAGTGSGSVAATPAQATPAGASLPPVSAANAR